MPHRTAPSFTVEIKRARKPSVHALTRKVVVPDRDTHHRPKTLPFDDLFSAMKPLSSHSLGSEATHDSPKARVGRILPSLSSMNSLPAREKQETKERPGRQRRPRNTSGRVAASDAPDIASGEGLSPSAIITELAPPTLAVQEAHIMAASSTDMPSGHVGEQRNKKGKGYLAAYRRAVRRGLPLPPLRAGERWKRRLPPACR